MNDHKSSILRKFNVTITRPDDTIDLDFENEIQVKDFLESAKRTFQADLIAGNVSVREYRKYGGSLSGITLVRALGQLRVDQLNVFDGESPTVASKISLPPGAFLHRFAEFFFSPRTTEQVVYPILSDMQFEYCEALACGRKRKATWIRIRGYWTFWKAISLFGLLRTVAEIWRKVSPN